jgi:hypothetical protein
VYRAIDFSLYGELAAGGYLIVAPLALLESITAAREVPFTQPTNSISNGAPDAVALIGPGVLIDSLVYEALEGVEVVADLRLHGLGFVTLTEGTGLVPQDTTAVANRALARVPNGSDTDDSAADWQLVATTPGAPNSP